MKARAHVICVRVVKVSTRKTTSGGTHGDNFAWARGLTLLVPVERGIDEKRLQRQQGLRTMGMLGCAR